MNFTDVKIYLLNIFSLTASFSNIDEVLKITLLLVSIGYTGQKWYIQNKKSKNE